MSSLPTPTARILVLDDDETSRYLLGTVARMIGAEAATVATPAEALALVESQSFACALVDKNLVGADGLDFLGVLRSRQPNCCAVVVTAYGNLQSAVKALQLGACDYVLKPFDVEALTQRLRLLVERHRLLVERDRMQAMLVQADRLAALGTMAAGIVHEINNPLTSIVPGLDMLLEELPRVARELSERPGADEEGRLAARLNRSAELARDIKAGVEHVGQIARDVKMFARAGGGAASLDARAVLEAALKMVSSQLRSRAHLSLDYRAVPAVAGDHTRLAQVFLNLLLNAVQATPEGEFPRQEIRVSAFAEEGWAVFEIADRAGGVPADHVPRLFEPFFTTKPAGEGTGLGLYISRSIVEAAGGRIELLNRPGEGATFRLKLPVADRSPLPGPRPRLLMVAPLHASSSALRRGLWSELDLLSTTSDELAVARLEAGERFDAILFDMTTEPAIARFLAKLEARSPQSVARLLVLKRRGAEAPRTGAGESLADRCLEKPAEPALVCERVRALRG